MVRVASVRHPQDLEFRILVLLGAEMTGTGLAEAYAVRTGKELPAGTMYVMLQRLRLSGLIEARVDDNDGRVKWFRTTQKGGVRVEMARQRYRELLAW